MSGVCMLSPAGCRLSPNVSRDRERTYEVELHHHLRCFSLSLSSLSMFPLAFRTTGPRSADLLDVCAGVPNGQAFSLFSVFSQERAAPPTGAIHAVAYVVCCSAAEVLQLQGCIRQGHHSTIVCITVCSSYFHN